MNPTVTIAVLDRTRTDCLARASSLRAADCGDLAERLERVAADAALEADRLARAEPERRAIAEGADPCEPVANLFRGWKEGDHA